MMVWIFANLETPVDPESVNLFLLASYLVSIVLSLRVIMRRLSVGTTLGWISVLFLIPFIGAVIYLLLGDIQLGARRSRRVSALNTPYREWLRNAAKALSTDVGDRSEGARVLHRQAYRATGMPAVGGNEVRILNQWDEVLEQWIADIDSAEETVFMEFYIWSAGGLADEVLEACKRALARGVVCRILVDSVGSDRFLKSSACSRARHAGVEIGEALPAGWIKGLFQRQDIRLHRKIVLIDGRIGYTGSLNMADAGLFKQTSGVGQWVDMMVQVQGPGVLLLTSVFLKDWISETEEDPKGFASAYLNLEGGAKGPGRVRLQPVPSGPGFYSQAIYQTLLTGIFASRNRMVLTTPYFVPDEPISTALAAAARRGVDVTLIVPERVDSRIVEYASRSHFETLMEAGVRIALFHGGLLHSKTITIDDDMAFVGSVNLDQRSFWINFEITLLVFDTEFCRDLGALQRNYFEESTILDLETWRQRPMAQQLVENTLRLASPLL